MARRRQLFGGNTTLAGALVTITVCVGALAVIGTGCVLMVAGRVDDGRETLLQGAAILGIAVGLLSRTRQDPAATVEAPAHVTATPTDDAEPAAG